jgi:cytochrome b6-f complex iron-sulfur subunit
MENFRGAKLMSEMECRGRREFLVKTTATVGGLILSVAGLSDAKAAVKTDDAANDVTVKIDASTNLNKVGGTYTFNYKGEPIIVVRKSETVFAAFSAICPHKGGPIKYNEKTQQLACPWHGSTFGLDGQRISGPAKQSLSSYDTESAVVVTLKA